MDATTMRRLVASAGVGRMATVGADGVPHLVPVCFALVHDVAYSSVDHKPKTSRRLRRITNIHATGYACLLVDEYDDDWSRLWWVRLDGCGRVVDDDQEATTALDALVQKYPQYAAKRPLGPVIAVDVTRYSGWSMAGD